MQKEGLGYKEADNKLNGRQQLILDIFRIVAAVFVIVGHSFSFYKCTVFKDEAFFPYLQNIGVVIFFLLSGFLTTFSLCRRTQRRQYSFSDYCRHKFFRIMKEYLPGLVIIAIIDGFSIHINGDRYHYSEAYNIKQFIGNLLLLQNMGPDGTLGRVFVPFGSGRPLWTLSVEWWLYMLFGAVFLSIRNKEKINAPRMAVFSILLLMTSHYLVTGRGSGLGFVFALGVSSYYVYDSLSRNTAITVFLLSILGYVVYGAVFRNAYTVYSFIILWMIFTSAIKIGGGNAGIQTRNPVVGFVSRSTFMLYLIHYSIIDLFANLNCPWNTGIRFTVGIICSTLLSFGAYFVFAECDLMRRIKKSTKNACDD